MRPPGALGKGGQPGLRLPDGLSESLSESRAGTRHCVTCGRPASWAWGVFFFFFSCLPSLLSFCAADLKRNKRLPITIIIKEGERERRKESRPGGGRGGGAPLKKRSE
ncbi:unnamed protein product [Pipistrellus nathusii]|uniref:Uncharacterized protein n=1 Tax=Pipistrellus nathusii TaxID=59473 RepID=A0ABP0AAA2_PIPNA